MALPAKLQPLLSSNRDDWCTPPELLARVYRVDSVGLDPCGNEQSIVGAATEWRLERDGDSLVRGWGGYGLVFVNPPYGRVLPQWVDKCIYQAQHGVEVIALLPARPGTRWYRRVHATAHARCWLHGRLRFIGAQSSAPFPSLVTYWGPRVESFTRAFDPVGDLDYQPPLF